MASKTAEDDLMFCPICFDIFENPRSLPCLHTFCYKCIDRHCGDKIAGVDSIECPICRRKSSIPSEGVTGFAHNFFIQRMVDSNRPDASQKGSVAQEASNYCVEHSEKTLELYCFNCDSNVCVRCVGEKHQEHKLQEIEEVASSFRSEMSADVGAVERRLRKTVRQNQRQSSALNDFRARMTAVASAIDKQCSDMKSHIETAIEKKKQQLLQELQSTEVQAMKRFSGIEEFTSMAIACMNSFINYSDLTSKGRPCGVTRAGNYMRNRASKILTKYRVARVYNGPAVEFKVDNVDQVLASVFDGGIVGRLVKTDATSGTTTSTVAVKRKPESIGSSSAETAAAADTSIKRHKVSSSSSSTFTRARVTTAIEGRDRSVIAMTVLDDELYLVSYYQPKGRVEVYNATDFSFQRYIRVKQLDYNSIGRYGTEVFGMTSCGINKCLYVSYMRDIGFIVKVELTGNNKVVQWSVTERSAPQGLSVNRKRNVMAACWNPDKLVEYTTHGKLVREIDLEDQVDSPIHAIQLNSRQILVSHGYDGNDSHLHKVSIVDASGRITQSYGCWPGSRPGRLHNPHSLAIDGNGFIYVADRDNSRIVVLDSALKWIRNMKISKDGVDGMCLDERRRQLLVAEYATTARVFVVKF